MIGDPPVEARLRERLRAVEVLGDVVESWSESHGSRGPAKLRYLASHAMAAEANHRLRQVLAQVGTRLELANWACRDQQDPGPFLEEFPSLMDALTRAGCILDTFLESQESIKLMIHLDEEVFDLAEQLSLRLEAMAGIDTDIRLSTSMDPTVVQGDPGKLLDVITNLVTRFQNVAEPGDSVYVKLAPDGKMARGFVGMHPARYEARALVDELSHPWDLPGPTIDSAYAQAILERHGGALYVERSQEDAVGFGFALPLIPPSDAGGVSP
ncbi:MAG: hypothetical protein R3185_08515 [Candidatus Thermoplasmatota archaeon]|nr:hypothetical protein [Candidatus Thermoplasmatota archaeon]